jgi:hypothetical protein
VLPTATTSVLGGVKIDGTSIQINNGVISLNAGLSGSVTFKGGWNASTNTPTLVNGVGTSGWMYIVTTTGTQNLGAGSETFSAGALLVYDGAVWINVSSNSGVVSFNTRTGGITLTSADVTTALTFTPYNATNPSGYTTNIGDVVGPATATDNAITRFDATTGKLLQNSLVTISDLGAIVAPSASSIIPFHYATQAAFPSATTYHGAIAHSHADGKMYFAHSGAWAALANASDIPTAPSINGIVKSNGTTLSAAVAGTDYIAPYTSQTANYILAAPNGLAGTPVFRAGVIADLSNLGAGVATFLATPTSANLASAITDETGSVKVLFSTSPTVTTSLVTDSASFDLLNTTATTVNFAGAATTLNIGVASGTTTIAGNLTVNGTTTTINSTTLTVDDKNIELGSVASPTNTTADGGGITLKGATDKTFNWVNATSAWTSSEDLNLLTGKVYKINGSNVLTASAVLNDSTQTSVTVGGYATTLSIGATTGTASILNTAVNLGTSTGTLTTVTIGGAIAGNILKLAGTTTSTTTAITTDVTTGTVSVFDTGLTGILNIGSAVGQTNIATGTTASGSTKTVNIGTAGLSGSTNTITIGSTSAGGTMIFGQSTATSTYNIAAAATVSGSTKTVAIGTAGLSGSTTAISIGSAVSGATSTLTISGSLADATLTSTAKSVGYLGLPQSATATSATLGISDAGKHIYVTTASQTITIPANASVAYPIGTTLTFIAGTGATTVIITINTDTMRLAGGTSTGNRTLAANGMATAVKVAATTWYINGTGLT